MKLPRSPAAALAAPDPRWYERLFDQLGVRYEEFPFTRGAVQETDFLIAELGLVAGQRVLDVGCGSGRHAIELASHGLTVTGIDLSLRLLEIALARARSRDVVVNLIHGDARQVQVGPGHDAALSLCEGAFGLLEDDAENQRVLERTRAALHEGGWLALNALYRGYLEARAERFPGYDRDSGYTAYVEDMTFESGERVGVHYRDRSFSVAELTAMVEAAGFRVRSVYGCTAGAFARQPPNDDLQELLLIATAV